MLCEKCLAKPVTVRIQNLRGDSGEALSTPVEHHFCEGCAHDYIEGDPQLRKARWSKPTKTFVINTDTPHASKNSE